MVSRVVSISRGSIPRASSWNHSPREPKRSISHGSGRWASSPTVSTPASRRRAAVFGPTPHSSEIASGARNAASSPGGTIVSPSGLSRSDAILAIDFVVPAPQEIVSPVSSRTRSLIQRPTSAGVAPDSTRCEMSMNASSSESGSTSGETLRKISITCCETSR